MHGRNCLHLDWPSAMSRLHVRNWKTRWSSGTAARRSATDTNGPYSRTPSFNGLRVTSTRGNSSPVRI